MEKEKILLSLLCFGRCANNTAARTIFRIYTYRIWVCVFDSQFSRSFLLKSVASACEINNYSFFYTNCCLLGFELSSQQVYFCSSRNIEVASKFQSQTGVFFPVSCIRGPFESHHYFPPMELFQKSLQDVVHSGQNLCY